MSTDETIQKEDFKSFCLVFTSLHFPAIPEDEIEAILLHRTPAEIAFIAGKHFPTSGPSGKVIPSCQAPAYWTEALNQMVR